MNMFKLRQAITTDAETLTELAMRSKAHWGYSVDFMKNCRAELTMTSDMFVQSDTHFVVAETAGEVVGFYKLAELNAKNIRLDDLFIDPKYMGQGLGKQLFLHAKAHAALQGGATLSLDSDPNAESFYVSQGMTVTGKTESGSIKGRYLPTLSLSLL
jgi:GNAT superfamily N-acetyltransferase